MGHERGDLYHLEPHETYTEMICRVCGASTWIGLGTPVKHAENCEKRSRQRIALLDAKEYAESRETQPSGDFMKELEGA